MSRPRQKHGNLAKASHPRHEEIPAISIIPQSNQKSLKQFVQAALAAVCRIDPRKIARRLFRFSVSSLGWVALCLTLSGSLFFLPRVSVDTPPPFDQNHPTPISFTITNANIIPLRSVQFGIGLGHITFNPGDDRDITFKTDHDNWPPRVVLTFGQWKSKWLKPDEKMQIFLEDFIPQARIPRENATPSADITIFIEFSPWYAFWRENKQFRYVTRKLIDGKTYWIPTPVDK